MIIKRWLNVALEMLTMIVCGISCNCLINHTLGNPLNIAGFGASVGTGTAPLISACVFSGLVVAVRLLWKKHNIVNVFLNTFWVSLIFSVWITFRSHFDGNGDAALLLFVPLVICMLVWMMIRNHGSVKFSTTDSNDSSLSEEESPDKRTVQTETGDDSITKNPREFNLATKICLGYLILEEAASVFMVLKQTKVDRFLGNSGGGWIAGIIIDVLIIAVSAFLFKPRKHAMAGLLSLLTIKTVAVFPTGIELSYGYSLLKNVIALVRDFGPMAIALSFKKDGVTGWRAIFSPAKPKFIDGEIISDGSCGEEENSFHGDCINEYGEMPSAFSSRKPNTKSPNKYALVAALSCVVVIILSVASFLAVKKSGTRRIEYFYTNGNTYHLRRHIEGLSIVPASVVFRDLEYNGEKVLCADCISDRAMKQIEDSVAFYSYQNPDFQYTPNIRNAYDYLKEHLPIDSVSEFAELLEEGVNRGNLFYALQAYGFKGRPVSPEYVDAFLYGGYTAFSCFGRTIYISEEERLTFQRLHPEAKELIFDASMDITPEVMFRVFSENKVFDSSYDVFESSLVDEHRLWNYYQNAKRKGLFWGKYAEFRHVMVNDNANYHIAYDVLSDKYDLGGYDYYVYNIRRKSTASRAIYNVLIEEGYSVPDFDTFMATGRITR